MSEIPQPMTDARLSEIANVVKHSTDVVECANVVEELFREVTRLRAERPDRFEVSGENIDGSFTYNNDDDTVATVADMAIADYDLEPSEYFEVRPVYQFRVAAAPEGSDRARRAVRVNTNKESGT